MAKVECYNCKRLTVVVSPKFRCTVCNYPLHKYIEQNEPVPEDKIIKDIDQQDQVQPVIINITGGSEGNESGDGIKIGNTGDAVEKVRPISPESKPAETNININTNADIKANRNEGFDSSKHDDLIAELRASLNAIKEKNEEITTHTGVVIQKVENINPDKKGKVIGGWLVVHTENKKPLTYELFEGENVIGRPDGPHHLDIKVEEDSYVSRVHCKVVVSKDFMHRFKYELMDKDGSTNGTYINAYEQRLPKDASVFLKDGDTVQVGETKMVFKNTNTSVNFRDAASHVLDNDYTKTVAIKL